MKLGRSGIVSWLFKPRYREGEEGVEHLGNLHVCVATERQGQVVHTVSPHRRHGYHSQAALAYVPMGRKRGIKFDIQAYLNDKPNPNLFIAGASGGGKSRLSRFIITTSKREKVVFNFKPHDEFLYLGYPIVNVRDYCPDPLADPDAFVSAFLIAFPMNLTGMTAQSIPSVLKLLLLKARTLEEMIRIAKEKSTDNIEGQAYAFVASHLETLSVKSQPFKLASGSVVLDFSEIGDDQAKSFYAELVLRQLWHSLRPARGQTAELVNVLLVVDEAHRLLREFGQYHSILVEMLREIRSTGSAVMTATQNYTDIEGHIRSQFYTQFVFRTTNEEDVRALGNLNKEYPTAIGLLPRHAFFDVAYEGNSDFIPVFKLHEGRDTRVAPRYTSPEVAQPRGRSVQEDEVLNLLSQTASYPTEIARALTKEGDDPEKMKQQVSGILKNLLRRGGVGCMEVERPRRLGQSRTYYYTAKSHLTTLHNLLQQDARSVLEGASIIILREAREGDLSIPDLDTPTFAIEVETGLKRKLDDLKGRIARSKKPVLVVVPNRQVGFEYKARLKAQVLTLVELEEELRPVRSEQEKEGVEGHA